MKLRGKKVTLLGSFSEDEVRIAATLRSVGAVVNYRLDDETNVAFVGRGVGYRRDLASSIGLQVFREDELHRVLVEAGHEFGAESLPVDREHSDGEPFHSFISGWTHDERTAIESLTHGAESSAAREAEQLLAHSRRAVRVAALSTLERSGGAQPSLLASLESRFDPNTRIRNDASALETLALASLLGAGQRTQSEQARAPRQCVDPLVEKAYAFGLQGYRGKEVLRELALRASKQLTSDGVSATDHLAALCAIGFSSYPDVAWTTISSDDAETDVADVAAWLDMLAPEFERLKPWELCFMYVECVYYQGQGTTNLDSSFRCLQLRFVGYREWLDLDDDGVELRYASRLRSHMSDPTIAAREFLEWGIVHYALARAVVPERQQLLAGSGESGRLVWLGHACGNPPAAGLIRSTGWDFTAKSALREHVLRY